MSGIQVGDRVTFEWAGYKGTIGYVVGYAGEAAGAPVWAVLFNSLMQVVVLELREEGLTVVNRAPTPIRSVATKEKSE